MKSIRRLFYLPAILIFIGLSGCYPTGSDLTYEDLDVSLTMYDKDYYTPSGKNEFQKFETFTVPDTIIHILDEGEEDKISRKYDKDILRLVRNNLTNLGYVEEKNPLINEPDLLVTVSIAVTDHSIYLWYPYWGWYWPYYPKGTSALPSQNYYYPYYPPWYGVGSIYTYSSGTLIMEMIDASRIDPGNEKIPVIWSGLVNGLLGGSESGLKVRVPSGINQCFDQSPYLYKDNL